MSSDAVQKLHQAFGTLAPDALAECQSICATYGLSAGDLFIRWQTLLLNRYAGDAAVQPTRERLLEIRAAVARDHERSLRQRAQASQTPHHPAKLSRNRERPAYDKSSVEGLLQGMAGAAAAAAAASRDAPRTPQSARRVGLLRGTPGRARGPQEMLSPSVFAQPSPGAAQYKTRGNAGRLEEALHQDLLAHVQPAAAAAAAPAAVVVGAGQQRAAAGGAASSDESGGEEAEAAGRLGRPPRMRYMFEKTAVRTETLNRRIERLAVATKAAHGVEALANPTYPHQDAVTAVGRVVNAAVDDGAAVAGAAPLSADALFLETSRRLGNGRRIALDVRAAASYALFPGQVVAVEGSNPKGAEFAAARFLELPRLPHASAAERCSDPDAGRPFSAVVAAGPYTLADSLDYEPLADLVAHAVEAAPSVVFLLGPFVAESHPLVRDGLLDMLPEDVFAARVSPLLERLCAGLPPAAAVYLVPAPDDLCCPYACYPQPAFSRDLLARLAVPSAVQSLPNPAHVSVNGVAVALANIDVLFHLVKQEVSRLPALTDRLPRLAWHLVEQRHLYPLSPPPPDAPAILAEHDASLRLHAMPDILVVPSQLRHFARVHENVVLLNPGCSSMRVAGGTFAKIHVLPPSAVDSAGDMVDAAPKTYPADCTSVEIVRI
ncbi:DNA-directed DNA polymerase alpha subunit pol12 [Coemansia erecta]|uniref:DNA polymerase alpha subunit B n=1 Tax=Coemansia erecta TaxID=147472 RepID=A0A9W7XZ59_9FUNG|nr:DNA-directed DNA polymerase alpha subunit pol12 [Coemansia erecta]